MKVWQVALIAVAIWWLLPTHRAKLIGLLLVLVGIGVG